ncbi:MAG: bifunctional 5,10-methylenetetrahydrofolate dehydrogenase/5,10-methenyltetrahydrofolate cyclohydrolase [Patescibacteria group bacterium]
MSTSQPAVILDGKKIAAEILLAIRKQIIEAGLQPGLAAILVGNDPASEMYVRLKEKACLNVGINFHKYLGGNEILQDFDETELTELIGFLNRDEQIDGILLQLPLPEGFDQNKIIKLIAPEKDADGFNGGPVTPPTVAAIIELLKATGENLTDKKTLIIGKSDVFTGGIEKYLKQETGIKKISVSSSLPDNSADFDIVIIALGRAHALSGSQVKTGAIVIDVGINKYDGQTVGDADPSVAKVAGWLSPVPGGVGPLTVACLLRNVLELAKKNREK